MKRRQWMVGAAVAALVVGGLVWALRPHAVPVEVAPVRKLAFEQTIDETGRTRVRERYVVSSPLAGRLARVDLRPGDVVEAGRPVAMLHPSSPSLLDARTVRELNERVGTAQAALAQARAEVARAEASAQQARADFERQKRLAGEGFLSPAARDQAALALRVQTQGLAVARSAEDAAGHTLAQARAALTRARDEPRLAQAGGAASSDASGALPLISPVTGRVLRVLRENEGTVAAGTGVLEVADPSDLEVVVDLLSTDAIRVTPGAGVRIDGGQGEPLAGTVRRLEPSAFTKVSALGIEEQRVNVIIDFVSPPHERQGLGDGYQVEVNIVTLAEPEVLVAPMSALFRDGAAWFAFVHRAGVVERREVDVAARNATQAWVRGGLAEGDSVVVYPGDRVRHGSRVSVLDTSR